MGNRNFDDDDFDFDFDTGDDDDLRGGDDDFAFDDDIGGDLDVGDDFEDIELGDELAGGFDFDDDLDEAEEAGGGPNRTFIILAAVMVIMFIVGLIAVVFLASNRGPSDVELTITARVAFNMTQERFATETQQANEVLFATQTALASITPTATPTSSPTSTSTPEPTEEVVEPTLDPTDVAATNAALAAVAQQTADARGTELAGAATDTPTPPGETGISQAEAVNLTATALVSLIGGADVTPTRELGTGGVGVRPTALPDTGLMDDIVAGGFQGFGAFLLVAFGLIGVIVVSRRLRMANK